MLLGQPIAMSTVTLSTTETANLIDSSFSLLGPGTIRVYLKGSAATVQASLFVNGYKYLNRHLCPYIGTQGTLDTSANMVAEFNTPGGIPEFKLIATSATPTADYIVTFEGAPFISTILGKIGGLFK